MCIRDRHRIKRLEGKTIPHAAGWLRAVSILLTWAIVLLLLYLMFSVVIPQLIDSVVMLINNAETYYNKIYGWITNLLDKNPKVEDWVNENLETYYQNLLDLLTNKVLPGAQQMLTTITGGVISGIWGLVSFAMDFLVGIIVSVYMLAMKEQSLARCCKLLYGVCKEAHARWIARAVRRADGIFSGFVRGKLLDSLIIGILCLIGCTILGMPYAPLVSLIVGVTNVIPFFGPFMGAVPSAFLILLVSPKKCLIFVIFVIVLQQFDGNILGPKILGDATGISSFWVMVAILVGGGFGGGRYGQPPKQRSRVRCGMVTAYEAEAIPRCQSRPEARLRLQIGHVAPPQGVSARGDASRFGHGESVYGPEQFTAALACDAVDGIGREEHRHAVERRPLPVADPECVNRNHGDSG